MKRASFGRQNSSGGEDARRAGAIQSQSAVLVEIDKRADDVALRRPHANLTRPMGAGRKPRSADRAEPLPAPNAAPAIERRVDRRRQVGG
jgi:hypothetical protein